MARKRRGKPERVAPTPPPTSSPLVVRAAGLLAAGALACGPTHRPVPPQAHDGDPPPQLPDDVYVDEPPVAPPTEPDAPPLDAGVDAAPAAVGPGELAPPPQPPPVLPDRDVYEKPPMRPPQDRDPDPDAYVADPPPLVGPFDRLR